MKMLKLFLRSSGRGEMVERIRLSHDGSGIRENGNWDADTIRRRVPTREIGKRKIILLLRDPRDVMVSFYFQATKRRGAFEGGIGEFIRSPLWGVDRFVAFYDAYLAHLEGKREGVDYILARYEDLHADCPGTLRRVLDFLGVGDADDDILDDAIERASFDNMRREEEKRVLEMGGVFRGADIDDPESFKTRKGKVGAYAEYLRPEDVERITSAVAKSPRLMDALGWRGKDGAPWT